MTTSPDDLLGQPTERDRSERDDSEVARLTRQLRAERERSLNATDRVLGAQAEAAQARAEIRELEYRLHVREAELVEARGLLDQTATPPLPGIDRARRAVAGRGGSALRGLVERVRAGTR